MDAAKPPDDPRPDAGYVALWRDYETKASYVFKRLIFKSTDVGHALINLEKDLDVDLSDLKAKNPDLADAMAEAENEDPDETKWTPALHGDLAALMEFDPNTPAHPEGLLGDLDGNNQLSSGDCLPPVIDEPCLVTRPLVIPQPGGPVAYALVGAALSIDCQPDPDECLGGDRCCQAPAPCCLSPDECCNSQDPCCGSGDDCCNADNPCCLDPCGDGCDSYNAKCAAHCEGTTQVCCDTPCAVGCTDYGAKCEAGCSGTTPECCDDPCGADCDSYNAKCSAHCEGTTQVCCDTPCALACTDYGAKCEEGCSGTASQCCENPCGAACHNEIAKCQADCPGADPTCCDKGMCDEECGDPCAVPLCTDYCDAECYPCEDENECTDECCDPYTGCHIYEPPRACTLAKVEEGVGCRGQNVYLSVRVCNQSDCPASFTLSVRILPGGPAHLDHASTTASPWVGAHSCVVLDNAIAVHIAADSDPGTAQVEVKAKSASGTLPPCATDEDTECTVALTVHVVVPDLDIDSDNDDPAHQPDDQDDLIEENAPGKYICVNHDDTNMNDDDDSTEPEWPGGPVDTSLIPIFLDMPGLPGDTAELRWRLTYPSNVNVWRTRMRNNTGQTPVLTGQDQPFPLPDQLYVEGYSPSATLGAGLLVLEAVSVEDGTASVLCGDRVVFTSVEVRVHSIEFHQEMPPGQQEYWVRSDVDANLIFSPPHWLDDDHDGVIDLPLPGQPAVDKQYPIVFRRGAQFSVKTEFNVKPSLAGETPVRGRGEEPTVFDIPETYFSLPQPLRLWFNVTCPVALHNYVQPGADLQFEWQVAFGASADFSGASKTKNLKYVLFEHPVAAVQSTLYQTVVHLACYSTGALADSLDDVLGRTWSAFTTRSVTTWDGIPLQYYFTEAGNDCDAVPCLLSGHDGKCTAFAYLLKWSFQASGCTDCKRTDVLPPIDHYGFAVKNIGFATPPTHSNPLYPYATADLDTVGIPGVPGQNMSNPSAKLFGSHYIIHRGMIYYDPSYGVTTTDEATYTAANIDAFAFIPDFWRKSAGAALNLRFVDEP